MIDFRYHIVSLISVFMALAVGIALGAGPLEQTIGDSLTGQVEVLREEQDALREELDRSRATVDEQAAFLTGAAPQLLAGTLTDRRVAVVSLGAVPEEQRVAVEEQLTAAGATVSARVQVTDLWTDPSLGSFRDALAANLVTYLDPAPTAGAGTEDGSEDGTETELAEALAQGLTRADPAAPDRLAEPAGLILELLASGDSELITVAEPVTAPADAVVVLTADRPVPDGDEAADPDAAADVVAAHAAVAGAAQARSEGVVLAGGTAADGDLLATVRADGDLAAEISTVTGVDGVTGQVSVPLALNARIGGAVGHYGVGDGLTAVPEPVTLTPPQRVAAVPAVPAG